ncbi:unnamed protein product [Cuscuta campestris]|uniref:Uncharacterized protein n=1 Tax=Cuscuta campestris TaxID=132261 RepID=A0A484MMS3_9ASTE|nr:unnamed protein product [Cuscuta campestris]
MLRAIEASARPGEEQRPIQIGSNASPSTFGHELLSKSSQQRLLVLSLHSKRSNGKKFLPSINWTRNSSRGGGGCLVSRGKKLKK